MSPTSSAKNLIRTFQEARQKKSWYTKIRDYRRFVEINYESDDFLVTTAAGHDELIRVLQLRHEVFVKEWQGRRTFHGLDVDQYDFSADHLLIINKNNDEIVGTYRLLCSHFTKEFYSASQFHLGDFMRLPKVKLELGRACVKPAYRDGQAIDLLWKGLVQYIAKTHTQLLFGCSSIKTIQASSVNRLYRTLKDQGSWTDEFEIRTTEDYDFEDFQPDLAEALDVRQKRELLPPLLRSYLHAGAKVYGQPALDWDFQCTDLFTVLDWSQLNKRFQSRFT
jgi:putative hemolysin